MPEDAGNIRSSTWPMVLNIYETTRRRRRRAWGGVIRIGLYLIFVLAVGAFAYQTAIEQVEGREATLNDRIAELEEQNRSLSENAAVLRSDAAEAQTRFAALSARYEREVPTGVARDLLGLLAGKLEDGVAPDRLAMMIEAASLPTTCSPAETRRFIVTTPLYDGPHTSVRFADGRITVTAEGPNAESDNGASYAWYDPARPITVTFTLVGGEETQATGTLPLHHSVVLANEEHRFSVVEGERSFIEVTGDHCSLSLDRAEAGGTN